jgi:hypothetical protein
LLSADCLDGTSLERTRTDEPVFGEIVMFLREHEVHSVAIADGIPGCPHEEGLDYPEGGIAILKARSA